MSLKPASLLVTLGFSLFAQVGVVEPRFECYESPFRIGYSTLSRPARAGDTVIYVTQPVPLGKYFLVNPESSSPDGLYAVYSEPSFNTESLTFDYKLTLGVVFGPNPDPLTITVPRFHNTGTRVRFGHAEAIGIFSYYNTSGEARTYSAGGGDNSFSPNYYFTQQPSLFSTGVHRFEFATPLSMRQNVYWRIVDQRATASTSLAFACDTSKSVVRAASVPVSFGANRDIRLGEIDGLAPGSYTVRIPFVFSQNPLNYLPERFSGVLISNIVTRNGVVYADISTNPSYSLARNYFFAIQVTDSAGRNFFSSGVLDVVGACPMNVSPSALPAGFVNSPYSATLTAPGAATFTAEGPLPAGLSLSESGLLTGTPTQSGAFPFNLVTYGVNGCYSRTPMSIDVQGQFCASNVTKETELTLSGFRQNLVTRRFQQSVTIRNASQSAIAGPIAFVVDNLSPNATLATANGATACAAPLSRPFQNVELGPTNLLAPGATVTFTLEFNNASSALPITYTPRILAGGANR